MRVDLNADLGEDVTDDEGLLAVVTSANVACGFHAGDAATMRLVCALATERGVAVGAQVSYADREGFGRRHMDVSFETLAGWVGEQLLALSEIARSEGTAVSYVKPHGALYNRVVDDAEQAAAVLSGAPDLPVLGLPGAAFLTLADAAGREVHTEGFPDRGYTATGRLIARGKPGALVEDEEQIGANALRLAASVDSVCVHGDSPHAVARARAVRRALEDAGYRLSAFSSSTGAGS